MYFNSSNVKKFVHLLKCANFNIYAKRFALLFEIFIFANTMICAQKYQGCIIDAETNIKLPFATIYVDADHKTISNADGDFFIETPSNGYARISYVGYNDEIIPISMLNSTIKMKPYTVQLHEIIAYPIDVTIQKILKKIQIETEKNKYVESNFLYRQTTFNNNVCNEFIEAFFSAKSELSLRGLSLIAGRYASLPSSNEYRYSYCTNFFSLSQLGIYTKKIQKHIPIPLLVPQYSKFYNVDYSIIEGTDGSVYVISFKAKRNISKSILEGKLYVNSSNLDILKFEGYLKNSKLSQDKNTKIPFSLSININYTKRRGFTEVESEQLVGLYLYRGKNVKINTSVFNVGTKKIYNKIKIKYNNNLKEVIASLGYDSHFWKENIEIKRTSLEKNVIKLFEEKNIFTNIK